MVLVFAIGEVTETDAHVVIQRARNGDGDGDSEDGVGDGGNVQVAVTQKNEAGGVTPEKGERGENRVGQVYKREKR